jgi:DNA-binding NarL/FixJ family response regulator
MAARTIVVLGDEDIRSQVRATLKGERDVAIVGELCALQPRHIGYIEDLAPELVILDCSSLTINPLTAVANLANTRVNPRVIAVLAEGGVINFGAVARMGAASIVTSPSALRDAIGASRPTAPAPMHGVAA